MKKPFSAEEKKRFDEFMKQEYIAKSEWLAENLQEVAPLDFYRAIFPEGSFEKAGEQSGKPNGLALEVLGKEKGARTWVVTDELDKFIELQDSPFALAAPSAGSRMRAATVGSSKIPPTIQTIINIILFPDRFTAGVQSACVFVCSK